MQGERVETRLEKDSSISEQKAQAPPPSRPPSLIMPPTVAGLRRAARHSAHPQRPGDARGGPEASRPHGHAARSRARAARAAGRGPVRATGGGRDGSRHAPGGGAGGFAAAERSESPEPEPRSQRGAGGQCRAEGGGDGGGVGGENERVGRLIMINPCHAESQGSRSAHVQYSTLYAQYAV